jgi:Family of unknown function (DUF6491)
MHMKTTLLAMPLAMLAACATTPSDPAGAGNENRGGLQERRMVRTNDCIFHSTINGFNVLDDRYIVLYGMGRRKAYLAEITGGCFDVRNQSTLAAVDGDSNGQICGYGRDSIAYRSLSRIEQCRILALEELSEHRRYELLGEVPPMPKDEDSKEDRSE